MVNVSTTTELTQALSTALPGDQLRLAAGTYAARMDLTRSGTASAPITLCAAPGARPIITGGRFRISADWVEVRGLVFEGPNGSENNVYITGSTNLVFTRNEVRLGDWHAGVAIESSARVSICGNFIHHNGVTDIDHGIYYRAQSGTGNVISNNLIVENAGRGISMHDNGGAAVSDTAVVHNTIVHNGSTGLLLDVNAGTGNVIANNVFSANGDAYDYQQVRVKSGTGNQVVFNIVWNTVSSRRGVEIFSGVTGNTVADNLALDPLFVTPHTDLHLSATSPARAAGAAAFRVPQDYDSLPRAATPSVGAYE